MPALCRDCLTEFEAGPRCPECGRPNVVAHPELFELSIAHMDCDAFYASVEKRDNPDLADKPLIIGGGRRGVVSTACYIARIRGVRSAMPMFQALKLCPDAVVLRGRMSHYAAVSRDIRALMLELTPAIEPLSLDEAFLDLTGTHKLHGHPPAVMLAQLVKRMKTELGLTGSIGLSHNKFLAKIASDLDKPQGFSVIGKAETETFLAQKPISILWGFGAAGQANLQAAGIHKIGDLRRWPKDELIARFGASGARLHDLSFGRDSRKVSASRAVKSLSNETTFDRDLSDAELLDGHIWRLSEKLSARAKAQGLAGRVVVLKLKTHDFKTLTRQIALPDGTQMADRVYAQAAQLLKANLKFAPFRLIGLGLGDLIPEDQGDRAGNLLDPQEAKRLNAERASDKIREKFGDQAILKGRALR